MKTYPIKSLGAGLLIYCVVFGPSIFAQSSEPLRLQVMRHDFERAIERALKPVRRAYIDELADLLEIYASNNQLDEATAINKEIQRVKEADPSKAPNTPLQNLLLSKRWDFEGAKAKFMSFRKDGTASDGVHKNLRWVQLDDETIVLWSSDLHSTVFRYDENENKFVGKSFTNADAELR